MISLLIKDMKYIYTLSPYMCIYVYMFWVFVSLSPSGLVPVVICSFSLVDEFDVWVLVCGCHLQVAGINPETMLS